MVVFVLPRTSKYFAVTWLIGMGGRLHVSFGSPGIRQLSGPSWCNPLRRGNTEAHVSRRQNKHEETVTLITLAGVRSQGCRVCETL